MRRAPLVLALGLALAGCAKPSQEPAHPHHGHAHGHTGGGDGLAKVAAIHGGHGPWAVLGYRMGKRALTVLGLPEQSFDLEVVHKSPRLVQYTCIADGAAAATGASVGKLNLTLTEADAAHVETTYRNKKTGASVTLRPTATFVDRFKDVPRENLADAGKTVMGLPDAELFEEAAPAR